MNESRTKFYAVSIPLPAVATFSGQAESPEHAKALALKELEKNGVKYAAVHVREAHDSDHIEIEELGYKPVNESW